MHPELLESADEISADKGYDSKKNNTEPLEQYDIKPVIDKRKVWQENQSNEKHSTRILYPDKVDSFVYDEQGHVYCVCPQTEEKREMAFAG